MNENYQFLKTTLIFFFFILFIVIDKTLNIIDKDDKDSKK
jgi:hypothetical protein